LSLTVLAMALLQVTVQTEMFVAVVEFVVPLSLHLAQLGRDC
jgi:hypothetical protein